MEQSRRFSPVNPASSRPVTHSPHLRHPRTYNQMVNDTARLLLLPAIVTTFLWMISPQDVSLVQGICAWLLLCFPWGAYLTWKRKPYYEVSLFAIVSAMYWLYFGVALFLGHRRSPAIWSGGRVLSNEVITEAMWLAVIGVACLWAGMRTPTGHILIPGRVPDIPANPAHWNYIRAVLAFGTLFGLFREQTAYLLGEGGRQFLYGLQDAVPLVAFIILFRHVLRGGASRLDKILVAAFLLSKFAIGVAGGWLGTMIFIALACLIVYFKEKRRIPWLALTPLLFYIVFFQAGKGAFRGETWRGENDQNGIVERVSLWASLSLEVWQDALDDTTGEKRAKLLQDLFMRTSLLTQTANVMEQTPTQVPYQLGATYSYLAATWIPRAIWPNKPSASEANRFYQVAYGLTTEENLDNVAMAVGATTEGYINFGWYGVVGIMYLLGLLFNWVQKVFLMRDSGLLLSAIGIMLVTSLIKIEAQLAVYIGGLLQQLLLVFLVFAPILHLHNVRGRSKEAA